MAASDERTSGFILRTRPLTETSLLVNWLTHDVGRITTVARGALRLKSPFRGKLDLFFLADFTFIRSRRSELHTLREVSVRDFNPELRRDLIRLKEAAYATQLIEQATETETPLPEFFQLVGSTLAEMAATPPRLLSLIAFESKFLAHSGLSPVSAATHLTPGSKRILEQVSNADESLAQRIRSTRAQDLELARFLGMQLIQHFGRTPKTRDGLVSELTQ